MKAERFWDFSVRTYRTSSVADACLALQNEYGADVNMLLFCIWTAAVTGPFDDELFECASEFSAHWADNVVRPLRGARTWMKQSGCGSQPVPEDDCMKLREEIKNIEFAAEKMQQEALESLLLSGRVHSDAPGRLVDNAIANLMRYLVLQHIPVNEEVREKLGVIIRAAFPDVDGATISAALAA